MNEQQQLRDAQIVHIAFWVCAGLSLAVGIVCLRSDSIVIGILGFCALVPFSVSAWGVLDTWTFMVERQ